ncbi:MAG: lysophospholipase L1-like esterase [Gammaproteobacteria bacterium]
MDLFRSAAQAHCGGHEKIIHCLGHFFDFFYVRLIALTHRNKRIKLALATIAISGFVGLLIVDLLVCAFYPNFSPDTVRKHAIAYERRVYGSYVMSGANRLIDLDGSKAWGEKAAEESSDLSIFINRNGYRRPSFEVRKPPGVYRIIVVGGSAVFDQNVGDSLTDHTNSWPNRVEALLEQRGFKHVEVINAGIPGQTSADSLARIYTQLWTYEPDMLVVYHGWNDFKFWHTIEVTPETPLIELVQPFNANDNPFMYYRGRVDRLFSSSQLYVCLRTRYFRWRWQPSYEGAVPKNVQVTNTYGSYGPRQYQLNLALIARAASAIGARPVLVKQATLVVSENLADDRARIGYGYQSLEHAAIVRAFQHSYRIIEETAKHTGALVVDPTEITNGKSELFSDHVHTTPAGSEKLAAIVAAAVAPFETQRDSRVP